MKYPDNLDNQPLSVGDKQVIYPRFTLHLKYQGNQDNQPLSVGDKQVAFLRFTAVTITRTLRVIKTYTLKVRVVICEAQSAAYRLSDRHLIV
jgi:hypothetical protein